MDVSRRVKNEEQIPERIKQLLQEVQVVAEEVENSAAKNDASTLYEGADRLSQKDIRKIKQMLKEGSITLDQQDVIERLLSTLMAEQQMRLKSEEQHCRMVDNLVRNQVKLVSQFTLLIMY